MNHRVFNKALLLCPPKYSLNNVFNSILREMCSEVVNVNFRKYVSKYEIRINTQIFRLPDNMRSKWMRYYQNKINQSLLLDFKEHNPDLVFVYNNEMLLPSALVEMQKSAKVIFFLGDSPFFTPTNNYFLTLLNMGDMVLAPDSFWLQHMQTMGIKNSFLFVPGIDESSYHQHPSEEFLSQVKETDILYCGMSYVNSWGYKKALLMSQFTGYNLEIYGDKHWKKWFPFFPELKKVFFESGYIPTPLLNAMFNKTKLMPVDGNPAILNGFHIRMFEALSAGVLPLVEYRKDVEESVFPELDIELPIIRSYKKAAELAERYLSDESLRLSVVSIMREHILSKYSSIHNAERLMELLRNSLKK